jgi:hypothetical protein
MLRNSAECAGESGLGDPVEEAQWRNQKRPVTMEELLVSSMAQTDALAKPLIEKGLIT